MTVLEFVEKYNKASNSAVREQFLKGIKTTPYVSIIKKDAYAQLIADRTMFEQEKYDDNGTEKYRKTDKLKVNSVAQYVQFCRVIVELYTDLAIDADDNGFIKGYDALKSSGILDVLMVGSDKADPLIPMSELSEFKSILDMKVADTMTNHGTVQSFVERQVERFAKLGEVTLTPFFDVLGKKLDGIPKEELGNKIVEFAKKADFREV